MTFSALVGLSQHVLVPERDDLQISQEIVSSAVGTAGTRSEVPGVYEDSVRSTGDVDVHPTVRSVALRNVVARGETLEDWNQKSFVYESEEEEEGSSWRLPEVADPRTIGKRMIVPRGRSLRTSQRPSYPCTLPSGVTCQASETCCGSACVTVATNPSHCGRCGHICSVKRECCSGKCRRLATDEKNCGACGSQCAPGVKCLFGLCGYSS